MLGRQATASLAQLLASLRMEAVTALLYKHTGYEFGSYRPDVAGYLELLSRADAQAIRGIIEEAVGLTSTRADAPTKNVFDTRLTEFVRWLTHDGWIVRSGALERLGPAVEEASEVRDDLFASLKSTQVDQDRSIATLIEEAATAFRAEPPDLNGSTTKTRIALETLVRRLARELAARRGRPYADTGWGPALSLLRSDGVFDVKQELTIASVYTFISDGAHVPKGLRDEEWARLSRTFSLSACYFVLKTYTAIVGTA